MNTIIEALYDWFDKSEALNADTPLQVDYLDPDEAAYSIQIIPCNPTLKIYADGSEKRQFLFVFAMRAPYGESSAVNMRNLAFFEALERWITEAERTDNLPELPEGYTGQNVTVLSSGYAMTNTEHTAQYQIQCRLTYIQEAGTV
jgi:hypothetical protein